MAITTIDTISSFSTLDVLAKYNSLIEDSLSSGSVYIKAKETINELAVNGDLTDTEKAKIISTVLTNLNNSLVSSSMSTALQWAEQERVLELKRLETANTLAQVAANTALIQAQTAKAQQESIAIQARTMGDYGTVTAINGIVTAISGGKHDKEMVLLDDQHTEALDKIALLQAQTKSTDAATHKVVADTYDNYGIFSYALDTTGVTSITDHTPAGTKPNSYYQKKIAMGQAYGYTWNAWSNAITSTASTLGTAMASGVLDATSTAQLTSQWQAIITKLENATEPTAWTL